MSSVPGKRAPWSAPLADFVAKAIDPVLARQGFGQADIVLHWEEIAGARLAQWSEPLRLMWPARAPKRDPAKPVEPATLVVQVTGAFALEAQHLAPLILERINARLGWRCVGRLQLKQAPMRARRPPAERRKPHPDALARASELSAGVGIEALRDALTRLGGAVLSAPEAERRRRP
ncbi:MAG TPA: DciA family protein [Beijerinckiaceae bacterium]|nr:DciA family protein [Beijerinckiaceae bacterium]